MTQSTQWISPEDLSLLRNSKSKNILLHLQAEKTILESQLADLEYKNVILSLRLKYQLEENIAIDENTGKIILPENTEQSSKE